ncbi:protein MpRLK-Pelle_WAK_LRK10L-1 [Marchantia polymorpha subsp. ruderalis]
MQERLSEDQALLVALEHLDGKARGWGRQFSTGASLEEFLYALFKQIEPSPLALKSPRADSLVPRISHAFAQMQESSCVQFSYRELAYATNIFSTNNLMGESEIGSLYQGRLPDKRPVAIRRLKAVSDDNIHQLKEEVKNLSLLKHNNLNRLLGYSLEPNEPLLVFEYEPIGDLSQHLHKENGDNLDWDSRFLIAIETAEALLYLHQACTPPMYHRNLKSSNILLDENLSPKVADFGISRSLFAKEISALPERRIGYIDPSYAQTFRYTDKSDVYSLGVILLELVSSKKVVDFTRPAGEITLAALALSKRKSGYNAFKSLLDPELKRLGKACSATIHEVAELALKCIALDLADRPTMKDVSDQLRMIQDRDMIRKTRGEDA